MTEIRRMVELYDVYRSYKRVARELGISRNSVRKYIRRVQEVQQGKVEEILPKNREIDQPTRVLTDTIRKFIHQHLESNLEKPSKQRLTAKQIWDLLIKEGHKIGYSTVKKEVRRWKSQYSPREVYILQEPCIGQRAEFDWGEVNLAIGGIWSKYFLAVFVLPFSLYRFARVFSREGRQEVIQAHLAFFQEIQGVPETIVYDRMAVVYDSVHHRIQERFLEFSLHFGFTPSVCNPASPHEKGTDEESVGYIRRNTFSEKTSFASLYEANLWLQESLHEMNLHPVYRRDQVPIEALENEREQMKPLPSLEYSNYDLKRAKISRYSLVIYENNYYSVPDTYRPRTITLKVNYDTIELVDGDSILATHPRLTGKRQYSLNIAHYVKTFHRKPGAIRNAKVLAQVDTQLKDLFECYYRNNPREFLPILDLIRESSVEALSAAITMMNEGGIPITPDTLRFFIHQQSYQMIEPLHLPVEIAVNEPDLQEFDRLMEE